MALQLLRVKTDNLFVRVKCFSICFLMSLSVVYAQTSGLSGYVKDASGAAVPQAVLKITNVRTNVARTGTTSGDGVYSFPALEPGQYAMHVEAPGFRPLDQTNITLEVARKTEISFTLEVGDSKQTVTVSGEQQAVQLTSQTIGYQVNTQMATELPLNGRNVLQLMQLAPDAGPTSSSGYQQGASRPEQANSYVGASGGRGDSTAFYLDGSINEDALTNIANVFPNPDAIEEFTFETNSYSAKYGGRGGGVMNAVTRGGTNEFHGTLFEFLRNTDLNAKNFFATKGDGLKRNQFGGTIGGPIRKDKTFFFFSYQGTTLRQAPTTNVATTLTAAQRAGDFSRSTKNIVDPTTGDLFPDKQVPTSMFDPIALKVLDQVPVGAPGTGLVYYQSLTKQDGKQFVGRLDHNIGEKFRIYGSYLFDDLTQPDTSEQNDLLTYANHNNEWTSQNAVLNATYTFRPNLLGTFVASVSRRWNAYTSPAGFPGWTGLGVNIPNMVDGDHTSAGAGITNYFSYYWNGFYSLPATVGQLGTQWSYVRGSHTLEFGAEAVKSKLVKIQDFHSNGYYTFSAALSGDNGLDFLLGKPTSFDQQQPYYFTAVHTLPAWYVSDSWKVNRRLTLTLGVRWNPFVPVYDNTYRQQALFSQAAYSQGTRSTLYPNLPPGLLVDGDPGVPKHVIRSNYHIFDPRVGFAFDPVGDGKTNIRAGFGIYQDQMTGNTMNPNYSPFSVTTNIPFPGSIANPYAGQYNPFPITRPNPSNLVFPIPLSANPFTLNMPAPMIQQWNFTVERQLPMAALLRLAYEGQESYHLFGAVEGNAAIYNPALSASANRQTVNARRPMGQYYQGLALGQNVGTASYNALVVSLEKRLTNGITLIAGYRWSKCMNESESAFFNADAYTSPNPKADRGVCSYDVPHQLRLSYSWQLPAFRSMNLFARTILGGWATNGIVVVRSGLPFSVVSGIDNSLSGINQDRADVVGDPSLSGDRSKAQKLQQWFNTSAFTTNALGTFGSASRNMLRGPGFANIDFSVSRSFPVPFGPNAEAQKLQFRADFFNLLNHANFSNPVPSVSSTTYGRILSAQDPRILQLALKFIF
jgi:hypothetical protein